jgi:hypothetical protein
MFAKQMPAASKRSRVASRPQLAALLKMRSPVDWLLDFANQDLSTATPKELDTIRWQLLAFAHFPRGVPEEVAQDPEDFFSRIDEWSDPARRSPLCGANATALVREIHARVRDGFQALLEGRPFVHQRKVQVGVHRWPKSGAITYLGQQDDENRFFAAVFQVLAELGPRFRVCDAPRCGRFFAQVRRQQYCSPACAQRVRSARFHAKHAEQISDRKHRAYAKRRRAKLGRRVRVARRPQKLSRRGAF